ncbi:Adenylate cyclase type 10, partial [Irineochytrium annulatum]
MSSGLDWQREVAERSTMNPLRFTAGSVRDLVLQCDADGTEPPTVPMATTVPGGAVAIVDISGFTKLTSLLMGINASAGAAQVRELLNPPFERIISIINRWGGSVVKFAGDAVIVCFSDADASRQTVLGAVVCNLELLLEFQGLHIDLTNTALPHTMSFGGSMELKIHIGIGVGDVDHIHIGEQLDREYAETADSAGFQQRRREYFVSGSPVTEAGDMLKYASKGGQMAVAVSALGDTAAELLWGVRSETDSTAEVIVLSEERAELIKDVLPKLRFLLRDNTAKPDVDYAYELNPLSYQYATAYLEESLALVFNRRTDIKESDGNRHGRASIISSAPSARRSFSIANGTANDHRALSAINQIRSVSIIFIRFPTIPIASIASPANLLLIQKIFMTIVQCLRAYGGCLRQFACDDKALTALIVFGLSGFAHERGEERTALLAASQLLEKLREIVGKSFSVGVTAGTVFAGIIGDETRSDGTVFGVCVNLAARIMTHPSCEGIMMCDGGLRGALGDGDADFEFEEMQGVYLKGISGTVSLYVPRRRAAETAAIAAKDDALALFGRDNEMKVASDLIATWIESKRGHLLLLTGISGCGKSALASYCRGEMLKRDCVLCSSSGNELLQGLPFYAYIQILKDLLANFQSRPALWTALKESWAFAASQPQGRHSSVAFETTKGRMLGISAKRADRGSGSVDFLGNSTNHVAAAASSAKESPETVEDLLVMMQEPAGFIKMLHKALPSVSKRAAVEVFDGGNTKFTSDEVGPLNAMIVRIFNKVAAVLNVNIALCFDDFQWMEIKPAFIPIMQAMQDNPFARTMHLAPLGKDDVLKIVTDELGFNRPKAVLTRVANDIFKLTQGNPMASKLICRLMKSEPYDDDGEAGGKAMSFEVPKDVTAVVVAQFDKSDEELQLVLKIAAVAGLYFNLAEVSDVFNRLADH